MYFKKGEFAYCPLPADIVFILTPCLFRLLSIPFILLKSGIFSNMGKKKAEKRQQCFSGEPSNFSACFLLICANCESYIAVFFFLKHAELLSFFCDHIAVPDSNMSIWDKNSCPAISTVLHFQGHHSDNCLHIFAFCTVVPVRTLDFQPNCCPQTSIFDKNAKSNTTYYYLPVRVKSHVLLLTGTCKITCTCTCTCTCWYLNLAPGTKFNVHVLL